MRCPGATGRPLGGQGRDHLASNQGAAESAEGAKAPYGHPEVP